MRDPLEYNASYLQLFANWSAHGGASRIDAEGVALLLEESGARHHSQGLISAMGLAAAAALGTSLLLPCMHVGCGCQAVFV
jgi:hypothetical protein